MTTLTVNNRRLCFFENIRYFHVFKFSIFITNIIVAFHHYNLFRFYRKYFDIILLLFLYFLGENKFVYSNKLLPFNYEINKVNTKVSAYY